ncbi:MAG TPA: efflux RND transporter periplasmic adaptor subunit [Flavobacterium sp.]|jgi:multidrug efflux pump subunit AcrA (membrane-fusion protein)
MKKVFIFLITALTLSGCGKEKPKQEETKTMPINTEVSTVQGIAIIEPAKRISSISAETPGIVKEIKATLGQKITKGQVLVVLSSSTEASQLQQARSRTLTQNKAVVAAQADLGSLKVQLNQARADLERNKRLFAGDALTKKELDDSQFELEDLTKKIEAIEAQVAQQRAKISEQQADEKYYSTLLNNKTVTAPDNGTLLSLEVKAGEYLDANSSIGEFAPEGSLIAITEIDELFAHKVKVGQKAVIRAQGGGETLATGTVILTSPYLRKKSLFSDSPDDLEDRRVREVRIQLSNPGQVLLGSKVECIIQVK